MLLKPNFQLDLDGEKKSLGLALKCTINNRLPSPYNIAIFGLQT